MKKIIYLIVMSMFILGMSACTIQSSKLALGKYVLEDAEDIDMAWIELSADQHFVFNRNLATSYRPSGNYTVENNVLTLRVNEDEVYTFKIEGDTLIFESGAYAESLLELGAQFKLLKTE